jgi:hypothetical protein
MNSLFRIVLFASESVRRTRNLYSLTRSLRYTFSDLGAVRDFFLLRPPASISIPC